MSEFENVNDDYDEDDYDASYDHEAVLLIQEEYRRKKLIESLIGPSISTVFHVVLIVILAILITDQYKDEAAEIVVQMEEVEEVIIEEPPPIEEPIPEEIEETDVTNPVLTTVAIETATSEDSALEDTNDEAPSTDDDSAVEAVSDVVVSPSAFASPSVFGGRSAGGRASAVSKFGGSKVGQASLLKALWWLAKVQKADGSWGSKSPEAFTGLALLTFLAHGETPTSKNFGTTVRKAMEWLAKDPIKSKNGPDTYGHAIKSYAIAEAYAMTGISLLEEAMNKNIAKVIDGMQDGGSYNYKYDKGGKEDLSLAGWNYQALKAAYGAGSESKGLLEAIEKSVAWLKKYGASNSNGDGFPYSVRDGVPSKGRKHTMRAVGVLCLQLFGEGQIPEVKDEIAKIATEDLAKLNYANPPRESLYGWYYATQAMFQKGGDEWKSWNKKFQKELIANQHSEGYWEYPGDFHGPKADATTDRVYATTFCALMLTVYYRYLPSTKGAIGGKGAKKEKEPAEEEDEGLNLIE